MGQSQGKDEILFRNSPDYIFCIPDIQCAFPSPDIFASLTFNMYFLRPPELNSDPECQA